MTTTLKPCVTFLNSPYAKPEFWDNYTLPVHQELETSALIVSHNRCPHHVFDRNPLNWLIDSLLWQRSARISELLIVDDASQDYTPLYLKELEMSLNLRIRTIHNHQRLGSARSRNIALAAAHSPYVFFVDDDCLLSPFALWGLQHTFLLQQQRDPHLCVVHAPFFFRDLAPVDVQPANQIGKVDLQAATYTTNLKAFPAEYLDMPMYLDYERKLLAPLPIAHLCGIFLARRDALLACGGFPEYFTWGNSFTEELELSMRLIERGGTLYAQLDPKCFVTHFKYGYCSHRSPRPISHTEEQRCFLQVVDMNAKNQLSNVSHSHTGNRVDAETWCFCKLISYFVFFGKRYASAGQDWMNRQYEAFVALNDPSFYQNSVHPMQSRSQRQQIWQFALEQGQALLKTID